MRYLLLLLLLIGSVAPTPAQTGITLEKIWKDYTFLPETPPGFSFSKQQDEFFLQTDNQIQAFDVWTGKTSRTVFDAAALKGQNGFDGEVDDYTFSADESQILLATQTTAIFRHSTQSDYFVWNGKSLQALFPDAKQRYAEFSPDGQKVAFVTNNNLYYKDLASGKITQVTADGQVNAIINGATDWVYEEEFSFAQAYQWSADGRKLAFYRFDETKVPEFTLTYYRDQLYPEESTFKYPKVGETNATVTIWIYNLDTGKTVPVDLDAGYEYIPRIKWTQDPNQLCVFRMNRHQNELDLLLADARTGETRTLLRETSQWYIDIHDNLTFLEDGQHFIWTSESDGWNHIYLYRMDGALERQLTRGEWEVSNFYGVNEKAGLAYFQAGRKSPLQREVYAVSLKDGKIRPLTEKAGWNSARFNEQCSFFIHTWATANEPAIYTLCDAQGKEVRVLEDNSGLRDLQKQHQVRPVEFFQFQTSEQVTLNGYLIKPANLTPGKKYPLLMFLYGGPGSQEAIDNWRGQNYWWFQMLAQQGFIVACVDNRGTGGRGEAFKKMTYLQLGKYETIDQIEAARYLGTLPEVDPARIGIFGWSYGGYMSSLCLLKGNDVFKAAIAVAPVTNWKWYDTIYTERYMRTEKENPEGYRDNSPVYFADRLKGAYLLVHGMGDDNVHFQNTAEMVNALVAKNKQFDTYFYPNRNHGIAGGPTRLHLYTKMTNFLVENL